MQNLIYVTQAGDSYPTIARTILGAGASQANVNAVANGLAGYNGEPVTAVYDAGFQIAVPSNYSAYAADPWFFQQQGGAVSSGASMTPLYVAGAIGLALLLFNRP